MEYDYFPIFSAGLYINSMFPTMNNDLYRSRARGPSSRLVHYDGETIVAE